MTFLRDDPGFPDLLRTAAADLQVPAALAEKDYWLTQVLRVLAQHHYGQFILKGGTSLSKGYRLLERFSEDVDILLLPHQSDRQPAAVEGLLAKVDGTLASALPVEVVPATAEEGVARTLHVRYPATQQLGVSGLDPFIRIDYGVGGGSIPQDEVAITPLIGDQLTAAGHDPETFEDLAALHLAVLHPARTLIEKLCIVHGLADRISSGNPHVRSREARHYYDIWYLLDTKRSPALDWIERQGDIGPLIADCVRITRDHYGSEPPIPTDGIAGGVAFSDPEVLDRVEGAYNKMLKTLAFPGRTHPTLNDVRDRIHEHAARLSEASSP